MNNKECKKQMDELYYFKRDLKEKIIIDLKEILLSNNKARINEIVYNTIEYINDI